MVFGASGLAAAHATHAPHGNYRGPARVVPAGAVTHQSNYRGPARVPVKAVVPARDPNRPASVSARGGTQR